MAAPTEKVTTNPYARYSLARLREKIAVIYLGAKTFASLTQAQQDDLDEKIDDATDRIMSEGFNGEPFWRRTIVAGIPLVVGQKTYELPADFKRMIALKETVGGKSRDVPWIEEHAYEKSWGEQPSATHPLSSTNAAPLWMGRGFSTNNQYIIERTPAPTSAESGGILYPLYRPYDGNVSDGDVAILPPSARRAQLHYAKWMVALDNGDEQQIAHQSAAYFSEIKVIQGHEGKNAEDPLTLGVDETFIAEMNTNQAGRRFVNGT